MSRSTLENNFGTTTDVNDLPRLDPETLSDLESNINTKGTLEAVIGARRDIQDLVGGNDFAVHDPETGETKVKKVTDIGSAALSSLGKRLGVDYADPSYTQAMEEKWEHQ